MKNSIIKEETGLTFATLGGLEHLYPDTELSSLNVKQEAIVVAKKPVASALDNASPRIKSETLVKLETHIQKKHVETKLELPAIPKPPDIFEPPGIAENLTKPLPTNSPRKDIDLENPPKEILDTENAISIKQENKSSEKSLNDSTFPSKLVADIEKTFPNSDDSEPNNSDPDSSDQPSSSNESESFPDIKKEFGMKPQLEVFEMNHDEDNTVNDKSYSNKKAKNKSLSISKSTAKHIPGADVQSKLKEDSKSSKHQTNKIKKAVKPAAHQPYAAMITAAIKGLGDKKGSSRQAILKYVMANNKFVADKAAVPVKLALRKLVASKRVVANAADDKKGAGSYKLADAEKKALPHPSIFYTVTSTQTVLDNDPRHSTPPLPSQDPTHLLDPCNIQQLQYKCCLPQDQVPPDLQQR